MARLDHGTAEGTAAAMAEVTMAARAPNLEPKTILIDLDAVATCKLVPDASSTTSARNSFYTQTDAGMLPAKRVKKYGASSFWVFRRVEELNVPSSELSGEIGRGNSLLGRTLG